MNINTRSRNKYNSFRKFLDESDRGEKHTYHVGFLCEDITSNDVLAKSNEKIREAHTRGLIELVQKKISAGSEQKDDAPVYEYIAIRVHTDSSKKYYENLGAKAKASAAKYSKF